MKTGFKFINIYKIIAQVKKAVQQKAINIELLPQKFIVLEIILNVKFVE